MIQIKRRSRKEKHFRPLQRATILLGYKSSVVKDYSSSWRGGWLEIFVFTEDSISGIV